MSFNIINTTNLRGMRANCTWWVHDSYFSVYVMYSALYISSGYQTARFLSERGAHVILACRDAAKAEVAIASIMQAKVMCVLLVVLTAMHCACIHR